MNFVMNNAPGAASIAQPVDQQSREAKGFIYQIFVHTVRLFCLSSDELMNCYVAGVSVNFDVEEVQSIYTKQWTKSLMRGLCYNAEQQWETT